MLQVEQVGGLAVAFNQADVRTIERELRRLDPNLFLDYELEPRGPRGPFVYPIVKEWVGEQHAPIPVLVWKDRTGPRPLSLAIVEQVKRQEKRDERLVQRVTKANADAERQRENDRDEAYDEISRAFQRAARNGGHFSGPVHRSKALAVARRRARRKRPA